MLKCEKNKVRHREQIEKKKIMSRLEIAIFLF